MANSNDSLAPSGLSPEELMKIFSVLSHDLKSPLFTIDGFSDLLLSDHQSKLDDEGQDFLNRIRASAQQMRRILDEMSHVVKLLARPTAKRDTSLREIVEEVRLKYNYLFDEKKATLEIEGDLPSVKADPEKMREALSALVSNAVFFNDRPAGEAKVKLSIRAVDEGLRLCVEDNGIGIDPRYTQQIFDLGLKLEKARGGGPGFGLYLAKKAIESQGGSISVESQLGEGSTFCLLLPRQ